MLQVLENFHVLHEGKDDWKSTDEDAQLAANICRILGYAACCPSSYELLKETNTFTVIVKIVTLTEESSTREVPESDRETQTTEMCLCVGWLVIACCLLDQAGRDAMLDLEESDSALLWAGERKAILGGKGLKLSKVQRKLCNSALKELELQDEDESEDDEEDEEEFELSDLEDEEEQPAKDDEQKEDTAEKADGETEEADGEEHEDEEEEREKEEKEATSAAGSDAQGDNVDNNTITRTAEGDSTTSSQRLEKENSPDTATVGTADTKEDAETADKPTRSGTPTTTLGAGVHEDEIEMMRKRELDREAQLTDLKQVVADLELKLSTIGQELDEDAALDAEMDQAVELLRKKTGRLQITTAILRGLEKDRMYQEEMWEQARAKWVTLETRLTAKQTLVDRRAAELEAKLKVAEEQSVRLGAREQQLDARLAELNQRMTTFAAQMQAREDSFALREKRLGTREEQLISRETRAEEREAAAAGREKEREMELKEREWSAREAKQEQERILETLDDKQKGFRNLMQELELREQNLTEQEKLLQQKIQELEMEKGRHEDNVAEQLRIAKLREVELTTRENLCGEQENALKKRESQLTSLEQELEQELVEEDEQSLQMIAQAYGNDARGILARQELLKRSQQEAAGMRARLRQRWVAQRKERQAKEFAMLCEVENSVKKLARTFRMAIGRLCLFDVDYVTGEDDTRSFVDNTGASPPPQPPAFTQAELQAIFRAIRREKELGSEEGMMKKMRKCPWSMRNKYVTDSEIVARMDVWWRDWLKFFDDRWGAILKERRQYLSYALKVLEKKRAQFPVVASIPSVSFASGDGDDMDHLLHQDTL
eukprot:TRINITY_DN53729_c0_g2_i1.p1 TRINITY_DN53729_c0_g2~~TRINITY_DN53729_c0_g2_i1.p1  ORF type:complete len:835 (-),score=141.49 TRINITY_DN53729_c0_g2_i1:36-2540(-)